MPTIGSTPNFALALPYGNRQNWTDLINGNLRTIDAVLATFVSVTSLQGLWANNTAYVVGNNVIDETSGVIYTAQVAHTSSAAPTTFIQERAAHSTYWTTFAVAARNRGTWATATAYALNDFVLAGGTQYAMCVSPNTSGATFAADLALGYWTVLVDLSAAGSLVLPVLSGAADANKVVITNTAGTAYVISSMTSLAVLLAAAGLATLASPAFTGTVTAPTQAAEDNSTKVATTAYADTAMRSLVIRRQTFTASGTYTPHAKMLYCNIETWGGGGAGGSISSSATFRAASGGGGAGGYSKAVASLATIGASKTVTIGAAGAASAAGNNNGGNGGDTSVGVICVGKGGSGGAFQPFAAICLGGLGGIAGTGDIAGIGMNGFPGCVGISATDNIGAGTGGSSSIGSGGAITGIQANGGAGTGKASGGSGATSDNAGGNQAGGAGTAGFVCITEFCYG
jgi:hypothetical protein